MSICLSSEVCPEIREYERFSTTCANAYVRPLMAGYLVRLQAMLDGDGLACPLLLMMSGGGLTTLEMRPVSRSGWSNRARRAAPSSPRTWRANAACAT